LPSFIHYFLQPQRAFIGFALLTIATLLGAFVYNSPFLMAVPFAILGVCLFLATFQRAYLLLMLMLPLSIEFEVGAGLATDLPTEPLMVMLMMAIFFYYLANPKRFDWNFAKHPIMQALGIHVLWIALCIIYSQVFIVSLKFLLAKTWYIATFVFVTALFVKQQKDFKAIFWCIVLPLIAVIIQTLIRHAAYDFGFQEANKTMQPFFRNHVNYAVMLALFFPFVLHARYWYKKGSIERFFIHITAVIFLIGIALAYTRAAYLSLLLMPIVSVVIRKRLMKPSLILSVFVSIIGIGYMSTNNNYLYFAPDYETTIYHTDLDDHLNATFEGKDVSSMERVYRWVAAARMSVEHPVVGFGPGNFHQFYKAYTVSDFETYVSDNEEQSGVHNYFLMMLVEQGFIGLLVFIAFLLVLLIHAERIYHRATKTIDKHFIMCLIYIIAMITFNLLLSDLIEVDKIGSLFFMAIAILVNYDLYLSKLAQKPSVLE